MTFSFALSFEAFALAFAFAFDDLPDSIDFHWSWLGIRCSRWLAAIEVLELTVHVTSLEVLEDCLSNLVVRC